MIHGTADPLVTPSGGRIEIESEPGAGTRVRLFLLSAGAVAAAKAGLLIPGGAS